MSMKGGTLRGEIMPASDPPPAPSRPSPRPAQHESRLPVARRLLILTGALLTLVTLALTGTAYFYVMHVAASQSLEALGSYVRVRGEREAELFQLAQDLHAVLAGSLVEDLRARGDADPVEEFARRYEKLEDGTIRSRRQGFDGTRQTGVFIGRSAAVNADLRRRVVSIESTLQPAGRLVQRRFLNNWMILPENISVQFWPAHPNDVHEAPSDVDFVNSEFYTIADPPHNPGRKSLWTKQNIDPTTKECMVTLSTPIYDGERFLGVLGYDILLADLVRRTMENRMEGTYNVLLRKDGFLIAHPELVKAIEETGGAFDIMKSGGPELQGIFRRATSIGEQSAVVESEDGRSFLGVAKIPGPDWFLVTIYPKALLEQTAYGTARIVFLGGLLALLIELLFVLYIVRTHVGAPLAALIRATQHIESGDLSVRVETDRSDELGRLAGSFNAMADAIREREESQSLAIKERQIAEEQVQKLNAELHRNLDRLRVAVEALSTPVLEVWQDVLALPLIGSIDEERSASITEKLLAEVVRTQCRFVILDVTGLDSVDTTTAHRLLKVVAAVELLGARCVITGIRPAVAQSLVGLGADFGALTSLQTLRHGLRFCLGQMVHVRAAPSGASKRRGDLR
jgi:two-component system, NtrC family, sensor kinase